MMASYKACNYITPQQNHYFILLAETYSITQQIVGLGNTIMGCYELSINLSLLAQGLYISWLYCQGPHNKHALLSNVMQTKVKKYSRILSRCPSNCQCERPWTSHPLIHVPSLHPQEGDVAPKIGLPWPMEAPCNYTINNT